MTGPAPFPDFDGTQGCAQPGVDPDLFFPTAGRRGALDTEQARTICLNNCPFLDGCLAYALTHQVIGVWGASTTVERQRRRHAEGIRAVPVQAIPRATTASCGTVTGYGAHLHRHEPTCRPCRDAYSAWRRDWKERKSAS